MTYVAPLPVSLRGVLIAGTALPYEINNSETGEVDRGVSYRLFVLPEGQKPLELSVAQKDMELYNDAEQLMHQEVEVDCLVQVNVKRRPGTGEIFDVKQSISAKAVRPAGQTAAARNGAAKPPPRRREPVRAS